MPHPIDGGLNKDTNVYKTILKITNVYGRDEDLFSINLVKRRIFIWVIFWGDIGLGIILDQFLNNLKTHEMVNMLFMTKTKKIVLRRFLRQPTPCIDSQ